MHERPNVVRRRFTDAIEQLVQPQPQIRDGALQRMSLGVQAVKRIVAGDLRRQAFSLGFGRSVVFQHVQLVVHFPMVGFTRRVDDSHAAQGVVKRRGVVQPLLQLLFDDPEG